MAKLDKAQRRARARDSQGRPLYREGEVREQAVVATEKRFFGTRIANPGGRRTPLLSRALREILNEPCQDDPTMTNAEAISRALVNKALTGDTQTAALIADRSEGKAPAILNVNVGLAERFASMTPQQLLEYAEKGQLPAESTPALPPANDIIDAEILSETPAQSLDQELVEKLREEARRKAPVIAEQNLEESHEQN